MNTLDELSNIEREIMSNIIAYEQKLISIVDLQTITDFKIRKVNTFQREFGLVERTLNKYIAIVRETRRKLYETVYHLGKY